jgi:hypothetical protein
MFCKRAVVRSIDAHVTRSRPGAHPSSKRQIDAGWIGSAFVMVVAGAQPCAVDHLQDQDGTLL